MPFNAKKILILAIFNYIVKKAIKDFDFKVLNGTHHDEDLYICKSCTRIMDARNFINFNAIKNCIYCNHKFESMNEHIIENSMNNNSSKLLII